MRCVLVLLVLCVTFVAVAKAEWNPAWGGGWQPGWSGTTNASSTKPPMPTPTPAPTSTPPMESMASDVMCEYDNVTYMFLDQIPTESPCLVCYCLQEFNGCLDETVCKIITCPMGAWASKCAPVFMGDPSSVCCPSDYRCPLQADKVKQASTTAAPTTTTMMSKTPNATTTMSNASTPMPTSTKPNTTTTKPTTMMPTTIMPTTMKPTTIMPTTMKPTTAMPNSTMPNSTMNAVCKFGRLTLQIGEQLADSKLENTVCSCMNPPQLTCVQMSPCPA